MSLVFANQLSSSLPRLSFTLLVLAGLFHWTASQRLQSHVVSCDGTGLSVMLHSIDETFYRGAPYVQGACSDTNCGQNGDSWKREDVGNNVTWSFHLSMAMLREYPHCSSMILNATAYYYVTKIVLPRLAAHIELSSDYVVEVRCGLHDMVTMTPPVNPVKFEEMKVVQETMEDRVETPHVRAYITYVNGDPISGPVTLGERLRLNVDFVDQMVEFWDQIRVLNFTAWNRDRTEHLRIVENGCPTAAGFYINATDTTDYIPVTCVDFDAFRFKEQEEVFYELAVKICKGRNTGACQFRCATFGRRKRATNAHAIAFDGASSRSKRSEFELLPVVVENKESTDTASMQAELHTRIVLPALPQAKEGSLLTIEYDDTAVTVQSFTEGTPRPDILSNLLRLPDTQEPSVQLTSSSHAADFCLDVVQLYIVCVLLMLVLLLVGCGTGFYLFKLLRKNRGRNDVMSRQSSTATFSSIGTTGSLQPLYQTALRGRPGTGQRCGVTIQSRDMLL